MSRLLFLLFLGSLAVFLALIPVPRADGQLIGSDGVGYYIHLRSLMIDGDLDFRNEYAHYSGATKAPPLTPLGRPGNKYAIGPALLWAPFFGAAHLLVLGGQALGLPWQANGDSYIYQAAISIGSIVYGWLGIWLAALCARRMFGERAALAGALGIWLASNMPYYMVFEPSMSHMDSLFAVALLLSLWFLWARGAEPPGLGRAALLGLAGGLVLLVRLQDAPFLLLPFGALLWRVVAAWRAGARQAARGWLLALLVAGVCALLAFIPQLIVWQKLYGTWHSSPYEQDHDPAFTWLAPHLWGVLFSTFHGLFSWHPIYLLALLGLLAVVRRERGMGLALLGLLAIQIYIVAAWWSWWQGDAFGGRMFLNATWIWLLGLAGLWTWLAARPRLLRAAVAAGVVLIGWNALALAQYRLGLVPRSAPLSWREMTIDRLALPLRLLRRVLT